MFTSCYSSKLWRKKKSCFSKHLGCKIFFPPPPKKVKKNHGSKKKSGFSRNKDCLTIINFKKFKKSSLPKRFFKLFLLFFLCF